MRLLGLHVRRRSFNMDGSTLDLRGVVDLLQRRLGFIALVIALTLGVTGLALLAIAPIYSATALMLVDPSKKNLLDPDAQVASSASDTMRVDGEVELAKSETTLLAAAKELDLADDPEFGLELSTWDKLLTFARLASPSLPTGDEALAEIMGNLRAAVSVQRRGLTFLIAVTGRSTRPEFAATLANTVARTYIAEQLRAKIDATLASASVLGGRVDEAGAVVARSEHEFDQFIDANVASLQGAAGNTELLDLRKRIAELDAERTKSSVTMGSVEQSRVRRDWGALADRLRDAAIANLASERLALLGMVDGAATGSPTEVDLRNKLRHLDEQLNTAAERAASGLRGELSASEARLSELRNQMRAAVLASDLPPAMLAGIYKLQQNAEIARAQYQTLLTRQKDLDTQAHLQVADSRLVSEATTPQRPSFPNHGLVLLLAALAGCGLGVGLAFLIENYVGGFASQGQLEAFLKTPVAAVLPRLPAPPVDGSPIADALVASPLSMFSETVRRARIGIDQAIRRRNSGTEVEGSVILVTSAAPGEGKTTVALSLARAYALAGVSTLLIDCDLRKPSVHRQLGIEPSEGLLDYLQGTDPADLRSILALDAGSGARVIVGSRRSHVATDRLVAGKTFARLIAAARQSFDIVVLDTPPVGVAVDGLYLAGMADAIAFVVKFSSTPQQEVKTALSALVGAKPGDVPILTVLNQQTRSPAAYGSKYAGYYAEA